VTETKLKPTQAGDSISYLPLLENPKSKATRQTMIQQSTNVFGVRSGAWKLCVDPGSGALGRYGNLPLPDVAWKKAVEQFGRTPKRSELRNIPFVQLFNLKDDPTESQNLAAERPELVKELFAILDDRIERGRSTPGPKLENDFPQIKIHNRVPAFVFKK
jgi:arylsulfatase A